MNCDNNLIRYLVKIRKNILNEFDKAFFSFSSFNIIFYFKLIDSKINIFYDFSHSEQPARWGCFITVIITNYVGSRIPCRSRCLNYEPFPEYDTEYITDIYVNIISNNYFSNGNFFCAKWHKFCDKNSFWRKTNFFACSESYHAILKTVTIYLLTIDIDVLTSDNTVQICRASMKY